VATAGPSARQQLIDVARREFAVKGLHGASVEDIVRIAGVTPPTLYHHFGNKTGLFVAVAEDAYRQVLVHFSAAVDPSMSLPDAVDAVLDATVEITRSDPSISGVVTALEFEVRRDEELRDRLLPIWREFRRFFDDLAARAPASSYPGAANRRALSRALIALVNGLASEGLLLRRPADYGAMVQAMQALLRAD
jgi:AcrR family transcriptional regulator